MGDIARTNLEKWLLREQARIGGLPSQLIDRYRRTVGAMIDGAREGGRLGYLRAARQPHRQTWWFRFIGILYSYLGLSRPLAAYLARRLQTLLITRIILLELTEIGRASCRERVCQYV